MPRTSRPFVSIVAPAYTKPDRLVGFLDAIAGLRAPVGGFELVIVDDGSPERLDDVVGCYRDRIAVTLVRQANAGPSSARNAGAAIARGTLLAFIDIDCRPAADWLTLFEEHFALDPTKMLGGRTVNGLNGNSYSAASMLILDAVYAFYNHNRGDARFCAASNVAVGAETFRTLGGFDAAHFSRASEDRDLCDRWRHAGFRIVYVPGAEVRHVDPLSFRRFWRQNFGYGRGAWRYRQARADRQSGEFREDVAFHTSLSRALPPLLSSLPARQLLPVAALLLIWQIANAAGFLFEAIASSSADALARA